jgi:hypothetical protein
MGIPNSGLAAMANLWGDVSTSVEFTYLATGSGDTAFAAADTTLGTEITDYGLERSAVTPTRVTTNVSNDTTQLNKTFTVTSTATITEVGILNASSAGDLGGRTVLGTPREVVSGTTYTLTHKTIFSRE